MRAPTLATVLTLADAGATYAWLQLGVAHEGNPILAPLVEVWGPGPAMMARAVAGVALVAALAALRPRTPWATWGLRGLNVVLAGVMAWHLIGSQL